MRAMPRPHLPSLRFAAWLGLCCACTLAASMAHAQVIRCVDPGTGKVTYTDGACASGASATEIERRKTDEELAQDRAREQEALQAKAERRQQELTQRKLQADERAEDLAQRAANRPARGNPAQSAACLQSRERYSAASDEAADKTMGSNARLDAAKRQMELDCMGPEAYSRLEASRPAPTAVLPADPYWDRYPYGRPPPRPPVVTPPPPAPSISRCDVFKCVDTQGYSHPRGQIGETARPPSPGANPRSCRSQGGTAPC